MNVEHSASVAHTYCVYCDESCHLEHDHHGVMVLGAVWCPQDRTTEIFARLRAIREAQGIPRYREIKWVKVSPGELPFYLEILQYFLQEDDLHFRAVVVPDKSILRHAVFGQTHDDWYYKMYYFLLQPILDPRSRYRVFLDYKDTRMGRKATRLREVLANSLHDFGRELIQGVQPVRSHEVELLQVADLLIGAVSYANRGLASSRAKLALIDTLQERLGRSLTQTTLREESKVNILIWHPRYGLIPRSRS